MLCSLLVFSFGCVSGFAVCSLHVRVRHKLVNDGLEHTQHNKLNLIDCGVFVDPKQWHDMLYVSSCVCARVFALFCRLTV